MKKRIKQLLALVFLCLSLYAGCRHGAPPIIFPPAPLPVAKFGAAYNCIAPDIGSADLLTMFKFPGEWPQTRARVNCFKWYSQQVSPNGVCAICGSNSFEALKAAGAFAMLKSWGIDQWIESAAIKEWGCSAAVTMPPTQITIDAVNQNGGAVAWLAMDEPLYAATTTNFLNPATTQRCGMTFAQAQSEIGIYISTMKAKNPGLKIAGIEPYPIFSAATLAQWIQSVPIDAFNIDIDHDQKLPTLTADLATIAAACKSKGIPFGIIFGGQVAPGKDFISEMKRFIGVVQADYGTPGQIFFQSWDCLPCNVPATLPESDQNTLTGVFLGSTQ